MIVPTVAVSVTAQSITPVDLSKTSFVMPSVKKASKKKKKEPPPPPFVLAKHKHSNSCSASNNSSII
jgi:hypothetical protein